MSKVLIAVVGGFVALMLVLVMIVMGVGAAGSQNCTGGGTGGPLPPPPPGQPGAGQIVNYLQKAGESPNAAAGVVGNLEQETAGINPTESDGSGGGGIAQWSATWYHVTGPNGTQSLDAFASSQHAQPATDQAQLAFIVYDLRTAYSWLQTKMNSAPDPQTAATMFETGYEECSGVVGFMQVIPGSLCNDPHRRQYAVAALHAANGGGTGTGTTVFVGAPVTVNGGACGPVTGPTPITNGPTGKILSSGIAEAPANAPQQVKELIGAGNRIIDTFYSQERRPGMLSQVEDSYDCSGATDFALYNAGLGNTPLVDVGNATASDSGALEAYGQQGSGQWVTVYASAGHAFLIVAGLALDTSHYGPYEPTTVPYHPQPGDTVLGGPTSGPRWFVASQLLPLQLNDGENWVPRHPQGL